jgi:L-cysteine desulfidase
MNFTQFLNEEWRPALGCTEPASVAYAAARAAGLVPGPVESVRLRCDARIYKNCYAVGLPNTGGRTGILWALAIGAHLPDPSLELECFKAADEGVLQAAKTLLATGRVSVEADVGLRELHLECEVAKAGGTGRVVIAGRHTRVVRVEKDGVAQPLQAAGEEAGGEASYRAELAALPFEKLVELARAIGPADRARLNEGARLNVEISRHGLALFGDRFSRSNRSDSFTRLGQMVFSGVHARMSGDARVVMTLSGSGNKGITLAVPLALLREELGLDAARVEEALALGCLMTALTTQRLGTLSAICGCTNAAGIGLAAALVYLQGGGERELSFAVSNMVGNVTGMICDGAKIGCALKAMTAVDAAFRAASLAMQGIGIPVSDGIVGADGPESLRNLGRIAAQGMRGTDEEILSIMQGKLGRGTDHARDGKEPGQAASDD